MEFSFGGSRDIIQKDEANEEEERREEGGGAEHSRTERQKRGILVSSGPTCAKMAHQTTKGLCPFNWRSFRNYKKSVSLVYYTYSPQTRFIPQHLRG